AVPDANVVNVVGFPAPSSNEYSSFHEPVVTEPMIGVGLVISWPSVNPVKLTDGGVGGGTKALATVMVTCAVVCSWESLALSCKTYTPATLNVACVTTELGLLNETLAGPLISLQLTSSVLPVG